MISGPLFGSEFRMRFFGAWSFVLQVSKHAKITS